MTPRQWRALARAVSSQGPLVPYRVLTPTTTPTSALPVILFLHGSGERGSDNEAQLRVGLPIVVARHPEWFPAIIVCPQAPLGGSWRGETATAAMAALDASQLEWNTDPDRVYLVGMSMGGYGVWQLAIQHPDRFAALVPVCAGVRATPGRPPEHFVDLVAMGAGNVSAVRNASAEGDQRETADVYAAIASRVSRVRIRLFHGSDDDVIPAEESRRMTRALEACGADVQYTEFAGGNHNAWDGAFGDEALWRWLWRQSRRPEKTQPGLVW